MCSCFAIVHNNAVEIFDIGSYSSDCTVPSPHSAIPDLFPTSDADHSCPHSFVTILVSKSRIQADKSSTELCPWLRVLDVVLAFWK